MMKRYYSSHASLGLSKDTCTPVAPSNEATLLVFANLGQGRAGGTLPSSGSSSTVPPFPTFPPLGLLQFRASSLVMEQE